MSMFSTGVLVLTSPLHTLPLRLAPVLKSAAKLVERTLYVHLHPGLNLGTGCPPRPVFIPPSVDLPGLISRLYSNAADVCAHLDVRLLLANIHAQQDMTLDPFPSPQLLSQSPEVVMTDFPINDSGQTSLVARCLQVYAGSCYVCSPSLSSVVLWPQLKEVMEEQEENEKKNNSKPVETYGDVVVGGTFDRLHGAHRTLLNICCLMANRRFLIGVCDQELLKSKVLKELIEPYSRRVQKLCEFLNDVKPSLQYEIVPLSDPFGPSVSDPKLQCIVVSEETRRGGEAVNRKRAENGLPELVLYEIPLIKDAHHADIEEEKISSSSLRTRLLGTLLVLPTVRHANLPRPALSQHPYVIGLTGGSGSGKSSITRRLEGLGAARIDADQLGHETYQPGTAAYHRIVQEFGTDIVNEDKTIDRRALGRKVFGNKERLKALTDIVWPEIALLVKERIQQAKEDGKSVCVVDAAVLLQAGWTEMVHEVWVAIIPEEEAMRRIVQRDGVSQEDALRRLQSQWSNVQLVEQANVVLCTLWEPDVTQRQVEKAWNLLQVRIQQKEETGFQP
ncbi:bifunctional coenzyme A synthase isoform X1 [Pangasianodon hypophthalmus]|uniref:bifunctional coenzyme A synthase isoform X1 n=1 Tax=Pangasianodon hypophthalmus TaxID=310915 RepID=UPI002307DA22|nr:bifunctional coenzyme A synthase isoform X1 [Pangasianodon hypophthalmus]XP_053090415.1 bifunctional coenzyme A synthase isoform X1 [Pangasianodon hypophthalmus]